MITKLIITKEKAVLRLILPNSTDILGEEQQECEGDMGTA